MVMIQGSIHISLYISTSTIHTAWRERYRLPLQALEADNYFNPPTHPSIFVPKRCCSSAGEKQAADPGTRSLGNINLQQLG